MSKDINQMSRNIEGIPIIYAENPQQCDFCGKIDELRPYGPKGECICFDCGMKDEVTTKKMVKKMLLGDK